MIRTREGPSTLEWRRLLDEEAAEASKRESERETSQKKGTAGGVDNREGHSTYQLEKALLISERQHAC